MFIFILHILCAILWTAIAVRTDYKESKMLYSFCAFLWWACTVIDIIKFVIA
jgi:hypothetical protein